MKSKLRKEFEDFKENTCKELWLLKHPLKYKFNDKLFYYRMSSMIDYEEKYYGVYKGEAELIKSWNGHGYCRLCYFETNGMIYNSIDEDNLYLEDPTVPAKDKTK
jgi:hypothetical protein